MQRQRATRRSELDNDDDSVEEEEWAPRSNKKTTATTPKRRATSTVKLRVATTKKQRHDDGGRTTSSLGSKSIYDMNIVETNDALKAVLKGQDESMDRLTDILFRFNQLPLPSDGDGSDRRILPLVLSGVSGTGKTSTAKLLKQLYQIDDAQYVRQDMTRMTDQYHASTMLGAAQGLVGSTCRSTLPMELLRAIGRAPTGKMDVDLTEEQYRQRQQQYREDVSTPPRTLLLHFEEADKADANFFTLVLNFIEDGVLTASNSDIKFVLPPETRLLVVFSANFASQTVGALCPLTQYQEARAAIVAAIEERGVPRAVLGRLPYVLPYFALDAATTKQISDALVVRALGDREHPYRAQFSHVTWDQNSSTVIDVIKANYAIGCDNETTSNIDLGVRGLEAGLETFKTEFYYGLASRLLRCPLPPGEEGGDEVRRRVTRSIAREKQRQSRAVTPHLTYRVFGYPSDELDALLQSSPQSFTRSALAQIQARLDQRQDVGLLMAHCDTELLLCLVDRCMARPSQRRLLMVAPSPTPPKRRLLLVNRQLVRCAQCGRQHRKNDPCDDILDDCTDDRSALSGAVNSIDMVEFALGMLAQQRRQLLLGAGP